MAGFMDSVKNAKKKGKKPGKGMPEEKGGKDFPGGKKSKRGGFKAAARNAKKKCKGGKC